MINKELQKLIERAKREKWDGLSLDGNQLTGLEAGVLPEGLKTLSLSGNQLTGLEAGVLPEGLKTLSIDSNQLTGLEAGVLPEGLKWLSLSGNPINALPVEITKRKGLYIVGFNPKPAVKE